MNYDIKKTLLILTSSQNEATGIRRRYQGLRIKVNHIEKKLKGDNVKFETGVLGMQSVKNGSYKFCLQS